MTKEEAINQSGALFEPCHPEFKEAFLKAMELYSSYQVEEKTKVLVGELKEGEHPDEINPRSSTWLDERRSWQAEVKQLQDHIKKLENG